MKEVCRWKCNRNQVLREGVSTFFWMEMEEEGIDNLGGGMKEQDWEGRMRGRLCLGYKINR